MSAAIDRMGGILAQRAMNLHEPQNVVMLDEGVVPAFKEQNGEFQNLLKGNVILPDVSGVQNVGLNKRNRLAVPPLARQTPGEGVLNTVQGVRDQFMKIQNNIESLINKKQDFSSADLMRMQYDVMQLTYINEISSKTADKTSQGAQTLFRNQG